MKLTRGYGFYSYSPGYFNRAHITKYKNNKISLFNTSRGRGLSFRIIL